MARNNLPGRQAETERQAASSARMEARAAAVASAALKGGLAALRRAKK